MTFTADVDTFSSPAMQLRNCVLLVADVFTTVVAVSVVVCCTTIDAGSTLTYDATISRARCRSAAVKTYGAANVCCTDGGLGGGLGGGSGGGPGGFGGTGGGLGS